IVHEVGHWLNLQHLWGEGYCGDDKVDDTPKQSTYTPGCPSGSRVSCSNSLPGDMYMNYMDFTNDVCMNMFTIGQRKRARALFEPGGARQSILSSQGLNIPQTQPAEVPDYYPKWLHVQVYPNPATTELKLFFEYDARWKGRTLQIFDITGRLVMSKIINSGIETIDISRLHPGTYFIDAWKEEEKLRAKFIKL
ncbi:MAG TPA: zinc-dependent metalloprotease, partial [Chitinophagaceae bacterium]|nr:zinc-dependent metalloprotease [Chitinophagaceae bacterium]